MKVLGCNWFLTFRHCGMEHKMVGMIFDNRITIALPLEILLHMLSKHQIYRRMEERKLLKPMRKQKLRRTGKWRREICYILKNCIRTPDKKNGWHLLWELLYVCMSRPCLIAKSKWLGLCPVGCNWRQFSIVNNTQVSLFSMVQITNKISAIIL